jgi:uncharacterized membrane protein
VAHDHSHGGGRVPSTARTRRLLLVAIAPFLAATLVGLVVLWPSGEDIELPGADAPTPERLPASVEAVEREPCDQPGQEGFTCAEVRARLLEGPEKLESVVLDVAEGPNARHIQTDDRIIVGRSSDGGAAAYHFIDYERGRALLILAILFAVVVIALSRLRGITAMLGTAVSIGVLIVFVLPAILEGKSPLAVAIVGGATVMFLALYMAHGVNVRTTTAVLGTMASLFVTGALALIFVEASRFSGFSSEEAVFLQISAQQINLEGLILGGIIIGTLGVLDDVTVTQASAVWEIHAANPMLGARDLYRSALRIGRAHIASTVNTLVLAYAGAALPLLVVFTLADRPLGEIVTGEIVAEEIVRTLVGSIGLVASVPITTGLAALVASRDEAARRDRGESPRDEATYRRPRAEESWREGI